MIRNKCTVDYKMNKSIKPYISTEIFFPFNEDSVQLDEYRMSFGLTVDINKKNSMKIFYIFKKEDLTESDTNVTNIFGLSYSLKLWYESHENNGARGVLFHICNITIDGFLNENKPNKHGKISDSIFHSSLQRKWTNYFS